MAKKKSTTTPSKTTKAKSTRKPKAPKKDINDMQVADGKDSLAQSIEEVKDLEQLLGVQQSNPFRTTSEAVLTERMNEMTLTDLQGLAINVGILPSGNKLSLKTKIMKAFKSHGGAGAGYNIGFQRPLVDPSSSAAEDILKISREGF
tara:strand:- start:968 stop:1408 length:441 start_codon:yes stop_codon:yes gene_type:complete